MIHLNISFTSWPEGRLTVSFHTRKRNNAHVYKLSAVTFLHTSTGCLSSSIFVVFLFTLSSFTPSHMILLIRTMILLAATIIQYQSSEMLPLPTHNQIYYSSATTPQHWRCRRHSSVFFSKVQWLETESVVWLIQHLPRASTKWWNHRASQQTCRDPSNNRKWNWY